MNTQGKVFKYPDNVDTDVIIPARYLNTPNAQELALHCMDCLLYTSPSPRDLSTSRMPSSA